MAGRTPGLERTGRPRGCHHLKQTPITRNGRKELLEHLQETFDQAEPELAEAQFRATSQEVGGVVAREVTWRWALIPTFGLVVLFLISLNKMDQEPISEPPSKIAQPLAGKPVIQVALLDVVGRTRGTNDPIHAQLQNAWPGTELIEFHQSSKMKAWRDEWPTSTASVIKIMYNVSSGELILIGQIKGENKKETFTLTDLQELSALLEQAQAILKTWLKETVG